VNLRHDRGVDQPRGVEQLLIVDVRVTRGQHVADRVVLPYEEHVQHADPEPPVPPEAGELDTDSPEIKDLGR
jgi:hypothetical protein